MHSPSSPFSTIFATLTNPENSAFRNAAESGRLQAHPSNGLPVQLVLYPQHFTAGKFRCIACELYRFPVYKHFPCNLVHVLSYLLLRFLFDLSIEVIAILHPVFPIQFLTQCDPLPQIIICRCHTTECSRKRSASVALSDGFPIHICLHAQQFLMRYFRHSFQNIHGYSIHEQAPCHLVPFLFSHLLGHLFPAIPILHLPLQIQLFAQCIHLLPLFPPSSQLSPILRTQHSGMQQSPEGSRHTHQTAFRSSSSFIRSTSPLGSSVVSHVSSTVFPFTSIFRAISCMCSRTFFFVSSSTSLLKSSRYFIQYSQYSSSLNAIPFLLNFIGTVQPSAAGNALYPLLPYQTVFPSSSSFIRSKSSRGIFMYLSRTSTEIPSMSKPLAILYSCSRTCLSTSLLKSSQYFIQYSQYSSSLNVIPSLPDCTAMIKEEGCNAAALLALTPKAAGFSVVRQLSVP